MTGQAQAEAMARAALSYWGSEVRAPKLINIRENIVFQVWLRDGTVAALRLHRPGYQSRAAIEAELIWTGRLAEAGMRVPEPVRTTQGRLTARVGDRLASCVRWLDGKAVGATGVPLAGTMTEKIAVFEQIGAVVGDLHRLTDGLAERDSLDRPRWDIEGLLGEHPRWGRFWENPMFSDADREVIQAARFKAREELARLQSGGADFGLVHADVLRENLLCGPQGMALIDFDDSGYGFRLYDLGTAVVQSLEEPALPQLVKALCDGYRRTRAGATITPRGLTLFILLRCLASAGWIMTRSADFDPRRILYRQRAMNLSTWFLQNAAPWD